MKISEGQVIRDRRLELGLTQEQVASELNMNLRAYQRYENDDFKLSNSRMKTGLRLCTVLNLDPYEIVPGAKEPDQ
ncbi:MAG: helix-turn-helix domain-containing protein [Clostridiales bacterium]|nr:helix-turn-helix domain-containing protein [Clostridiales bacterium]